MAKFTVRETTEVNRDFTIEAKDAKSAIRMAKNYQYTSIHYQSEESHFIANEIKEEDK